MRRRVESAVHTIKDGVVIDNARLLEEVARMVAVSKEGVGPDVSNRPFVVTGNR